MSDSGPGPVPARGALVFCTDLIFGTRISATARALGVQIQVIRSAGALEGREPALLLVDLDCEGAVEAIAKCRASCPAARIIAFGPHVEAVLLQAARDRGADEALARSVFTRRLPELLTAGPGRSVNRWER